MARREKIAAKRRHFTAMHAKGLMHENEVSGLQNANRWTFALEDQHGRWFRCLDGGRQAEEMADALSGAGVSVTKKAETKGDRTTTTTTRTPPSVRPLRKLPTVPVADPVTLPDENVSYTRLGWKGVQFERPLTDGTVVAAPRHDFNAASILIPHDSRRKACYCARLSRKGEKWHRDFLNGLKIPSGSADAQMAYYPNCDGVYEVSVQQSRRYVAVRNGKVYGVGGWKKGYAWARNEAQAPFAPAAKPIETSKDCATTPLGVEGSPLADVPTSKLVIELVRRGATITPDNINGGCTLRIAERSEDDILAPQRPEETVNEAAIATSVDEQRARFMADYVPRKIEL